MKRMIKATSKIPTLDDYIKDVEARDMDVISYLINKNLITLPSPTNELGINPYYSRDDKTIYLYPWYDDVESRMYGVPYTEFDRIFLYQIIVYDDSSFKIGQKGKVRQLGQVSDDTLKRDIQKAKNEMMY